MAVAATTPGAPNAAWPEKVVHQAIESGDVEQFELAAQLGFGRGRRDPYARTAIGVQRREDAHGALSVACLVFVAADEQTVLAKASLEAEAHVREVLGRPLWTHLCEKSILVARPADDDVDAGVGLALARELERMARQQVAVDDGLKRHETDNAALLSQQRILAGEQRGAIKGGERVD
jgi:hypothetical protein